MVTIDHVSGFSIVIYAEDHPPPHVHVKGNGEVKIQLVGVDGEPEIIKNRGVKPRDVRRAWRLVLDDQLAYLRLGRRCMAEPTDDDIRRATERGDESLRTEPHASSARYDAENRTLIIELTNGSTFTVPTDLIQSVRDLTPEQIAAVEVSPTGYGLHWEAADFDITVPGLVSGVFGSRNYMDALWAARAGSVTSPAKAAAARANGAKGGRPRKSA